MNKCWPPSACSTKGRRYPLRRPLPGEATGLDDTQLRTLEERLNYLREMEERRSAILASIEEQGKLTPELAAPNRRRRNQTGAGRPLPSV